MNKEDRNCEVTTPNNITWYGVISQEWENFYSIWSSHTHSYVVIPKAWVKEL